MKVSPAHLDFLLPLRLTINTGKPLSHLTVFNFFEPLHYYTFNTGFQTWELSPEHAIRSWAYILMHWPLAHLAPFALKIQKVSLRSYIAHSNLIKDEVIDSCYLISRLLRVIASSILRPPNLPRNHLFNL